MTCSSRFSIPHLIFALSLASLVWGQPARAQASSERKQRIGSVAVRYDDLDLTRDADAEQLLGRLEQAAFRACGGDPKRHPKYKAAPVFTAEVFRECREEAVADAVAKIDSPALSRVLVRRSAARVAQLTSSPREGRE